MKYETKKFFRGFVGKAGRIITAGALAASMGAGVALLGIAQAYAADGTVTITAAEGHDGATFDAYRIFTADISESNKATHIAWADDTTKNAVLGFLGGADNPAEQGYDEWLIANKHMQESDSDADKQAARDYAQNAAAYISANISSSGGSDNSAWKDAGSFAVEFAQEVMDSLNPVGTTALMAEGDAGYSPLRSSYTGVEGYYLFLTTNSTLAGGSVASAPIWFPLGGASIAASEKSTPVTLEKEIFEDDNNVGWGEIADAELGQVVSYRIQITTPGNYSTYKTFKASVEDALPAGMTINSDSVTVKVGDTSVRAGDENVVDGFTVNASGQSLQVSSGDTKAIKVNGETAIGANTIIVVEYTATVNSAVVAGAAGNVNKATYTFSNDPQSNSEGELEDTAKLYTYFVSIDKTDEVTSEPVRGAEFVIRNSEGKYLSETGFDADSQDTAKVFTSDENGAVNNIRFLDQGTYTLTEISAPDGYRITAADTTVVVSPTYATQDTDAVGNEGEDGYVPAYKAGDLMSLAATVTGGAAQLDSASANSGEIAIDVVNTREVELAITGQQGVGIAGAVVLVAGVVLYVIRRRRAEKPSR